MSVKCELETVVVRNTKAKKLKHFIGLKGTAQLGDNSV